MDEVRLAARRLTKRPGATIASIVTLACAIGAAAATWSLLSAVLLRPIPIKDSARVVVAGSVVTAGREAGTVSYGFIYPQFPVLRDSGIFERVAAEWSTPLGLMTSTGSTPVTALVGFATFDFFDLLGLPIAPGRTFTTGDDRRGAPAVAILTNRYWQRAFDAGSDVLGRSITVGGKAVTVIGVAPRGFRGLDLARSVDLYLPLHTIGEFGQPTTNYFADTSHGSSPSASVRIVGRLRDDSSISQTTAQLRGIGLPSTGRLKFALTSINIAAVPVVARAGMTHFARLLGATVALLLLIGCATVGMLLLIRTEARRDEFALCIALGASGARLARGVAMEGVLLSAGGAALAIPIAWWLFAGVRAFQLPGSIDIGVLELRIDVRAIAATVCAAVFASIVITLIAGTLGLRANAADSLRARAGATPRMTRRRTRAALVAAQVAVALVLVAGAGLFARSLAAALSLNADLDMRRVVTGSVSLEPYGYNATRATAFFDELRSRLARTPAVTSTAFSVYQFAMAPGGKIPIDGVPREFPSMVTYTAVSQDYFRTMGIQIRRGRDFTADDRANSPPVTIVSESFGRMLAEGGDPLGRRITMGFHKIGQPPAIMEISGVVSDVVTNVSVLEPLVMYFPMAQTEPGTSVSLRVRAASTSEAASREVMTAIKQIDSSVTPSPMSTLADGIARQMSAQQFGAMVLSALGVIAVLLTVLGTYVLAESMAAMRMREMGIRAALGVTGRQLGAIVIAETARLVGLGLVVGLGLAWLGANTIRAFLFQVKPLDPVTLGAVAALILTLALAVSLRPALRAARVDLGRVLKEE